MVKIQVAIAVCVVALGGCCLQTVGVIDDGGTTSGGTTTGGSSSTSQSSSSSGSSSRSSSGSTTTTTVGTSSGSTGTEGGSTVASTSTGSSGSTGSTAGNCIANVLNGTPCPAGQTCNQTGTACVGDFADPCESDADCPCGCGCSGAPDYSCTNCISSVEPYFPSAPDESNCGSDSDCGPECLGFTCSGGFCEGSGLLLSPPSEAQVCAANPCTDAGVACASLACTPDGGECAAGCGADWTCLYGEDLQGPVLPGHCGEISPGDAGFPAGDGGFLGTFGSNLVFGDETGGVWEGAGGGVGPNGAYTNVVLQGPDAGTFIVDGLIAGEGCSPVFQIVRPDFAVATTGTVCPLDNFWFSSYVLTFGYAALDGDQMSIETLWMPEPAAPDAGAEDAVWYLETMTRQ
jgi:hypothetical protein